QPVAVGSGLREERRRSSVVEPAATSRPPAAATAAPTAARSTLAENKSALKSTSSPRVPIPFCPSCKAKLAPGATMCPECGWMSGDLDVGEIDGQALVCTNAACGVANPPSERYCQRCNTLLPNAPGTVLHGRYQVERLLAEGGFGKVYLAKDVKANRQVAIKDMICEDAQEFELRLGFFQR